MKLKTLYSNWCAALHHRKAIADLMERVSVLEKEVARLEHDLMFCKRRVIWRTGDDDDYREHHGT